MRYSNWDQFSGEATRHSGLRCAGTAAASTRYAVEFLEESYSVTSRRNVACIEMKQLALALVTPNSSVLLRYSFYRGFVLLSFSRV